MKTRYCLVALLALMACTREANLSRGTGYLTVRLGTDLAVTPVVKAEAGEPDPAFSLEIIPVKGGETIQVADYRTLADAPMTLPVGDYTVKAVSGPDKRQSWEEPRYEGKTQVSIQPDRLCEAAITATLVRTMVTVEFDPETAPSTGCPLPTKTATHWFSAPQTAISPKRDIWRHRPWNGTCIW